MLGLMRLAWRNVLRNKRRTLLAGLAVGMGLAAMIFIDSLMVGMFESMIRTATDTFMGQGQIHAPGFRETLDAQSTITSLKDVRDAIEAEPGVAAYTERTLSVGMVSSAAGVSSALVYGLDPRTETRISRLKEAVIAGRYLGAVDAREVLVGSQAADTLELSVGDKVVLTMAEARTGELRQELFRVAGIFRFGVREADTGMVYVPIERARAMLGIGGETHEIALRFTNLDLSGDALNPIWGRLAGGGNEALGWRALLPQLDGAVALTRLSSFITTFLVFAVVALIIMNTLFMSLSERIYEFGILRAIGTRPMRMAGLIVLEAASLSIVSIAIGLAIGLGAVLYWGHAGIDYTGIDFAEVTITERIYPILQWSHVTMDTLLILLFSIIASLYPAFYATRLRPARALRRSL